MGDAGHRDKRLPGSPSSMKGRPAQMPDDAGLAACATLADPKKCRISPLSWLQVWKHRLE
jgi:hypothetical protein